MITFVSKYKLRATFIMCSPVFLYGSEAWTTTSRGESRLQAAEMRFLTAAEGCTGQDLGNEDIIKELGVES
jgi:hypothetical protein